MVEKNPTLDEKIEKFRVNPKRLRNNVVLEDGELPNVTPVDLLVSDERVLAGLKRHITLDGIGDNDTNCYVEGIRSVKDAEGLIAFINESRDKTRTPQSTLIGKLEENELAYIRVPPNSAKILAETVKNLTNRAVDALIEEYKVKRKDYLAKKSEECKGKLEELNEETKEKLGFSFDVEGLAEQVKNKDASAYLDKYNKKGFELEDYRFKELEISEYSPQKDHDAELSKRLKDDKYRKSYKKLLFKIKKTLRSYLLEVTAPHVELKLRSAALKDAVTLEKLVDKDTLTQLADELKDEDSSLTNYLTWVKERLIATLVLELTEIPQKYKLDSNKKKIEKVKEANFLNIFVDNSKTEGQPVIVTKKYERGELFGTSKDKDSYSLFSSKKTIDHLKLVPGAMNTGDGGYVIMDALELLRNGNFSEVLRVLELGEIDIMEKPFYFFREQHKALTIPIKPRVVMYGSSFLRYALRRFVPSFRRMFKTSAHVSPDFKADQDTLRKIAGFTKGYTEEAGFELPVAKSGFEGMLEQGIREANDQEKIVTDREFYQDVARFAYIEALERVKKEGGEEAIIRIDVENAVEKTEFIEGYLRDRIRERQIKNRVKIFTGGEELGQVNGLSVMQFIKYFGSPTRITASASLGMDGITHIEEKTKNLGKSGQKAIHTLTSIIAGELDKDAHLVPLALSLSFAFEQSYGGHDGDSATVAHLVAAASALTGRKIRQGIAMTGSADQYGRVQAIGGANWKLESFYEVVAGRGELDKDELHGVAIPKDNVENLMLRKDVVASAEAREFDIYEMEHVSDAFTIFLDGTPTYKQVMTEIKERVIRTIEVITKYGLNYQIPAIGTPAEASSSEFSLAEIDYLSKDESFMADVLKAYPLNTKLPPEEQPSDEERRAYALARHLEDKFGDTLLPL